MLTSDLCWIVRNGREIRTFRARGTKIQKEPKQLPCTQSRTWHWEILINKSSINASSSKLTPFPFKSSHDCSFVLGLLVCRYILHLNTNQRHDDDMSNSFSLHLDDRQTTQKSTNYRIYINRGWNVRSKHQQHEVKAHLPKVISHSLCPISNLGFQLTRQQTRWLPAGFSSAASSETQVTFQ